MDFVIDKSVPIELLSDLRVEKSSIDRFFVATKKKKIPTRYFRFFFFFSLSQFESASYFFFPLANSLLICSFLDNEVDNKIKKEMEEEEEKNLT